jgi:hypothetical protein
VVLKACLGVDVAADSRLIMVLFTQSGVSFGQQSGRTHSILKEILSLDY